MHNICIIAFMTMKYLAPTLFILLVLMACDRIQEPEFRRIDDFKVKSINLSEATIGFRITYYNPNAFTMAVKETGAQVSLDGVDIGKFVQDTGINVGSKSEFSIPVSGKIPFNKLMQLNPQNLGGSREVHVKAVGDTKVGKAGIFITKPFTYEGKHRLDQFK